MKIRTFLVFLLVFFLFSYKGWADFNLSVIPFEGGTSLRFGRVESSSLINQEIKLRITSTESRQYQVFQRVIEPFVNERGVRLNMDALTSYTLKGSNSAGTLYQEEPMTLGYGDELLYTSNPNGDSDSFKMIYTVRGNRLNTSGNFLGKILYTLQPIGGGTQQTYILNVFMEAAEEFKIEIKGSSGMNLVRLSTQRDKDREGYVAFSFKGNLGKELRIYQEVREFPQNELKEEISEDYIKFFTSGGNKGTLYYTSPSLIEKKRLLLYSSDQENDVFSVNFLLDEEKIWNQTAGMYRGRVSYLIEGYGVEKTISLDLEIEVIPVFKLEVGLPPEGMRFKILPTSPPLSREVVITVKTNLAKPYMITQSIHSSLTNEENKQIPSQLFTMKEELSREESGRVKFTEFSPVPLGEVTLFFSDEQGSPAQFKVIYRLKPNLSITAGEYSTIISYSLGERG